MLIANIDGNRIDAKDAEKGPLYTCPACGLPVILRKGMVVTHNFAHAAKSQCSYGGGESHEHMSAKRQLVDVLCSRGLDAAPEVSFLFLDGDRRADVAIRRPDRPTVAIELQHTPLVLSNLLMRVRSYADNGVAQMWVPLVRKSLRRKMGDGKPGPISVEKYAPPAYELWLHDRDAANSFWMYRADRKEFWSARFSPHLLWQEYREWSDECYGEQSAGGFHIESDRFRNVFMEGPYALESLRIRIKHLPKKTSKDRVWPKGMFAFFSPLL